MSRHSIRSTTFYATLVTVLFATPLTAQVAEFDGAFDVPYFSEMGDMTLTVSFDPAEMTLSTEDPLFGQDLGLQQVTLLGEPVAQGWIFTGPLSTGLGPATPFLTVTFLDDDAGPSGEDTVTLTATDIPEPMSPTGVVDLAGTGTVDDATLLTLPNTLSVTVLLTDPVTPPPTPMGTLTGTANSTVPVELQSFAIE